MGPASVHTASHNRFLTLVGVILLAGFLHGNLTIRVLHDVSYARSSSPDGDSDHRRPDGDGAEIGAPCVVCSSVPVRPLPTDLAVTLPTLDVPALVQTPAARTRWSSTCLVSFEARAPPALS